MSESPKEGEQDKRAYATAFLLARRPMISMSSTSQAFEAVLIFGSARQFKLTVVDRLWTSIGAGPKLPALD